MTLRARVQAARVAWWLRKCEVGGPPALKGRPTILWYGGTIRLGANFRLASVPVRSHLAVGPDAELTVEDDVSLGHGAAVAAFKQVTIGAGTRIAPFVIIMDTNFHSGSGKQSMDLAGRPIVIGRNCRIGSRVTITRGVSIGDGSTILAGSVVSSSLPADVCAGGVRAQVLGSARDTPATWDSPAVMVPLLIMNVLGLTAPPAAATETAQVPGWEIGRLHRLSAHLLDQFGVEVDAERLLQSPRVGDVANLVADSHRRAPGVL